MAELLRLAAPEPQSLTVRSDEHPAYPRALARLRGWLIRHECTPSVAARTSRNPLFPVNLLDLLLRHSGSNHKRETIAFSKRDQSVIERAAVLIVWRNFIKPFSERRNGGTPAMRAGICQRPLTWRAVLQKRMFPSQVSLPQPWRQYYTRDVFSPRISNPRRHQLKLAF